MVSSTDNPNARGPVEGPQGDPSVWGPVLMSALGRQRHVCCELEALSERQAALISAGNTDGLLRVLTERQALVNQIAELSASIEPFRRQWDVCLGQLPPSQRAAVEADVRELNELVGRIWSKDEEDKKKLQAQRDTVSAQITSVSRTRVAVSAYGAPAGPLSARYQDRNG